MINVIEESFAVGSLDVEDIVDNIAECTGLTDEECEQLYNDMLNNKYSEDTASKLRAYNSFGLLPDKTLGMYFSYFDLDMDGNPIEYDLMESYLDTSSDDQSPNYDVTIDLPYYEDDDDLRYYTMVIKADNYEDAEDKAKRYIQDRKRSKNAVAWKDAKVLSIYER